MITDKILDLAAAFRNYGYIVTASPIDGQEDLFASELQKGLDRIEATMRVNAKNFGMRGRSKRALSALHQDLPEPVWGVEAKSP